MENYHKKDVDQFDKLFEKYIVWVRLLKINTSRSWITTVFLTA